MNNKYEQKGELEKYQYGVLTALCILITTIIFIKYGWYIHYEFPMKYFNAILISSIINNGIGFQIYRRKKITWSHYFIGFLVYTITTFLIIGIMYLTN
jgi:hypothetical protein